MLVGATINWYAVTDAFQGSGLQTWFTNNLNYIPGFDEFGASLRFIEACRHRLSLRQ